MNSVQIGNKVKLTKSGIRYCVVMLLLVIIQAVILFSSAGKLALPRFWIFIIFNFIYSVVLLGLQIRLLPDLINHRGKIKPDTKSWDQVLMRAHNLMLLLVMPVIVGLDVGRYGWSYLSANYMIPGFVLYLLSNIFVNWAMFANPHFEATVRIQKDRDHQVISSGPYQVVRHPGYLAGILWAIGVPMILGSVYGFIPGGLAIILFFLRTYLEDKTLQSELNGYREYSQKVKFRIVPGVW